MKISHDLSLAKLTTMRVGGDALNLIEVKTTERAIEALLWAKQKKLQHFILGGGSNTIFTDKGFSGVIILNKIKLKGSFEITQDGQNYIVSSGSGEIWDDLVKFSVENHLSGIEALSLIPGTVGAAPVQNIGAYGQQVSDTIYELEAIDTQTLEKIKFKPEDCNFSYRSSRFNSSDKGNYLITSVKFKLKKANYTGRLYKDVEDYFKINQINIEDGISPEQIREAVIAIRSRKLPDPKEVANTGSFFKNPIIDEDQFAKLKSRTPQIMDNPEGWNQPPFWKVTDGYKISAGWLVGESGFGSFYDDNLDFGTWPKQNLVLYSKSSSPAYANLKKFRDEIKLKVRDKFRISLNQEPEEVVE
jgi:UDP-N-acetylmuramate dehydrogenase